MAAGANNVRVAVAAPASWPPRRDASLGLLEIETTRQGGSIDLTSRVRLRPEVPPVRAAAELSGIPGVEGVDMRRAD